MKNNIHRLTLVNFMVLMLFACIGYLLALAHGVIALNATDPFKKVLFCIVAIPQLAISTGVFVSIGKELYKKHKPTLK